MPLLYRYPKIALVMGLGVMLATACQSPPPYAQIEGKTMGTSYHIHFQVPKDSDAAQIQATIDQRLIDINKSMSTYDNTATIMAVNRAKAGEAVKIDPDFVKVMTDAKIVYQASSGAFDPTVLPLVKLWGFGGAMTVERLNAPPTDAEIAQAKAKLGFDAISLDQQQVIKSKSEVALDFSAIAKGYGVDAIASLLKNDYHIQNYMVEIGGEVATLGKNSQGASWQIGIDAPEIDSRVTDRKTIAIISNSQTGKLNLATSGNYRNSLVYGDMRVSHTIDPTTGKPIVGGAPSVTVAHETTSLADAWATALTAMPYDKALALAHAKNLAVLFVIHTPDTTTKANPSLADWQIVQTPKMQALRAGKTTL